jgi:hypothetical protein
VLEILGTGAGEEVGRHVFSIFGILGQLLFRRRAGPVIERPFRDFRFDEAEIGRAAAHMAPAVLSALKQTPAER